MKKRLYIKPFDLKADDVLLIEDFSIDFSDIQSICLLGESGSGKGVLLKTIRKYSPDCVSFYLGEESSTKNYQKELSYEERTIEEKSLIDEICRQSFGIKKKIGLLKCLFSAQDYFFSDDLHSFLNHAEFIKVFDYIIGKGMLFFYATSCIEDSPSFDYLMIVKNQKIAIEGKTISVLKEEKMLKTLGYALPFYVNMSIQLGYYGLLKKICFTKEELEAALWK